MVALRKQTEQVDLRKAVVAVRKRPKQIDSGKGGKAVPASPLSDEDFKAIADEAGQLHRRYLSGELKETRLQKRMKSGF